MARRIKNTLKISFLWGFLSILYNMYKLWTVEDHLGLQLRKNSPLLVVVGKAHSFLSAFLLLSSLIKPRVLWYYILLFDCL